MIRFLKPFSHQAEAAYYGEHEASVFEEALQFESDVPQEIIAQAEPYTLFIYKTSLIILMVRALLLIKNLLV